jgi:hypothetical protein
MNQIGYGLGLSEVHPTVEKGAFGELSWFRGTCTCSANAFEDTLTNDGSSMTLDLDDVLPGVAMRAVHDEDESLIENAPVRMI